MYPPLIIGNWKMNGNIEVARDLAAEIVDRAQATPLKTQIVLCPSFVHLALVRHRLLGTNIALGAQDCYFAHQGAYTGDTSAAMLADIGCQYVIIGHSERRGPHGDTNEIVCQKAEAAYKASLKAIICMGETQKEHEAGDTLKILENQWRGSIPHEAAMDNTIIAYEPIWAIGTGLTAKLSDLELVYSALRKWALEKFGQEGQHMRLLYGGSVKSTNINDFKALKDIGGVLVGGASLDAEDFFKIVLSYN
jgi:triosephosphate isomerase (TIM)